MAPLPKRRHSSRRQGKRRFGVKIKVVTSAKCPNCSHIKLPHRPCSSCGYYSPKLTLAINSSKPKKEAPSKTNP